MGVILFLELASSVILNNVVHPTMLERFDDIYSRSLFEYDMKPHPFMRYVQPHYIAEKERYLQHVGPNQLQNKSDIIYIVALGGSTTKRGYPRYTESYLNRKLGELNSSLEAQVFNFGVDGWSSFQSVQNYFYLLKYLHPDFIIIHHNHNEGEVEHFFNANTVEYYPEIGALDRRLISASRFYKLLKFAYLLTYNKIRYGEDVRSFDIIEGKREYAMSSRISAYLNDKDPGAFLPRFFERDFIGANYPEKGITREFILTENYESLIRYARADGAEVVLTTQYQNFSNAAPGKFPEPGGGDTRDSATMMNEESQENNELIRKISEKNRVPLVDLERDMVAYNHLLLDETHFLEEGIQAKGELVGAKVWEVMKVKYNLTENLH